MKPYADTNLFTEPYIEQPDARKAQALMEAHRPILPVTWLLRCELTNAFEQAVCFGWGAQQVRVTPEHAAACHSFFRDDLQSELVMKFAHLPLPELTQRFEEIALRQTARHGFRTYDILHVASALTLGSRAFWSFDKRASKLAKLEGLKTI